MEMKEVLMYFSFKYSGDFDMICKAIANKEKVDIEVFKMYKQNLKDDYITLLDDDYPISFKSLSKPPLVLYLRGNKKLLKDNYKIAIIGSRKNTSYGEKVTNAIVKELVDNKVTIVSGLAKGIDGISHQETLNNHGRTIAIIGSGFEQFYPHDNNVLYQEIIKEGLVISEYPYFVKASKDKFLRRNGLIASLANKLVVIEGYKRSGTLNTVCQALELGKEIYCVPNVIFKDSVCNNLIKDGANIVTKPSDILE